MGTTKNREKMKIFEFFGIFGSIKAGLMKPLVIDGNGKLLDHHGAHGGHGEAFDEIEHNHKKHGGPVDKEGIKMHGHGKHGYHKKTQWAMFDQLMQLMNWHGPHGGHMDIFKGLDFYHGPHDGPTSDEGKAAHGHGPHGGHSDDQIIDTSKWGNDHDDDADADEHSHGHGHGHGHSH